MNIAQQALDDVARWLGFRNTDHYMKALPKEKSAIFKRAKRARVTPAPSSTPDAAPPAERGEA